MQNAPAAKCNSSASTHILCQGSIDQALFLLRVGGLRGSGGATSVWRLHQHSNHKPPPPVKHWSPYWHIPHRRGSGIIAERSRRLCMRVFWSGCLRFLLLRWSLPLPPARRWRRCQLRLERRPV